MSVNEFEILFKDFSDEEFSKLSNYFISPYFDIPNRLQKLHELIKFNRKQCSIITLSRDEICIKFYPGEEPKKNYHNIRKLISEYKSKTEEFTAYYELTNHSLAIDKAKLWWLRRKKDRVSYKKKSDKLLSFLDKFAERDDLFYYEKLQIILDRYNFFDPSIADEYRNESIIINDFLDKYFTANKLYLFQNFISFRYTNNFDIGEIETFKHCIINFVEKNKHEIFNNDPEICFRYLGYLLNANGFDKEIYSQYKNNLLKFEDDCKLNENGFYFTLLNLLSKFINEGHKELDEEVIKLANLIDERGIIHQYDFSFIDLKIIIESAIGLKMYNWALAFTEKYKNNLKGTDSINQYLLITGKLQFFKGNLEESGRLLSQVRDEHFIHYIEVRLIELRISVVNNDLYSAEEYIAKAKKYIKAHKEMGNHFVNAYSIFLFYINRYIQIKKKFKYQNMDEFNSIKLRDDIENEKAQFYASNWLKELINRSQ
jgi:hypothetical protein